MMLSNLTFKTHPNRIIIKTNLYWKHLIKNFSKNVILIYWYNLSSALIIPAQLEVTLTYLA